MQTRLVKTSEKIPDTKKIAVLRANSLGDFLFMLPALEALRNTYPEAEIVLLAKKWHAAFLEDRPGPIDRVIVVPPCEGVGLEPGQQENPDELAQFFAEMKREHFDIAIQLHGGGHYSNPFVLKLGARMTVGLKAQDAAPLDRWLPYVYFQSEVVRYLEVIGLLGATPITLAPRLLTTEDDLCEAEHALAPIAPVGPLVALHPGANDPRRRWPVEKFAAVGDALAAEGARIVVTGTKDERDLGQSVVDSMRTPAHNLCGRFSLGGLAGLFRSCAVVLANDTGPLHLAAAVGAATVGVYWCGNLVTAASLTRLRNRLAASWRLECPVCGTNCMQASCDHEASFVADVATEEVIDLAKDLLHSLPA